MQYKNLGKSGLVVSRVSLGCMSFGDPTKGRHSWILNEEQSRPIIRQAVELGINFFDTANMYGAGTSEEVLGRALKDFAKREEMVVASKVFMPMREDVNGRGLSRKAIMTEIDASLIRLRMDYIDLYQIHRWDETTPIEETLEALHDVIKAGKVRYTGASSMYAWRFAKALYLADKQGWSRFISMQPQYNLMYREEEREMLPLCLAEGIGVMPWSPLARGRLAHPWADRSSSARFASDAVAQSLYGGTESEDRLVVDRLTEVAAEKGVPQAQVALAWVIQHPSVSSTIIGATNLTHLKDAIAALDISLTASEKTQLEEPYLPHVWQTPY
jgi:aryl-alcohol dehydrogenase-like predicted oxidoreductase